ncbi:MAG: hypothetical protein JOZ42_03015 [Acetobacteraceae bacterium]|nr:hypothetical protein [Acetobacteraceae bacterium]
MTRSIWLFAALLLAGMSAGAAAHEDAGPCEIPQQFVTSEDTLSHVGAALAAKQPVEVLAIGSATTVGQDLMPQGTSFPYRMIEDMRAALHDADLRITVLGGRGLAASEMLDLLRTALQRQHFALVLWQTGTVEAVRGLPPEEFRAVLEQGIDAIAAQGGDTLLIDPQFSRFLQSQAELEPYEAVFREEDARRGVIAFRRFDLMRQWAENGELDLEHVSRDNRGPALDKLHGCLGTALSRLVVAAAAGSGAPHP